MIYGTRAVMEAIASGREIDKILIQSGQRNELIRELTALAREHNVPVSIVPQEKLKRISTKNHQGVICFLSPVSFASLDNVIFQTYQEGREPFLLLLDRVTDVRNFGAIVRTAECAGIDGVVIPAKGSAPITSDAVKTSAGALSHLPVCREKDFKATLKLLRDNGITIFGCTEKAKKSIYDTEFHGPVAILMGSEEDGISDTLMREVDELVLIPMKGKINSLNVSVAAGIVIYEVIRQRESQSKKEIKMLGTNVK